MVGWVGTERMVRQPLFVQENTIFTERTVVTSGIITIFTERTVVTSGIITQCAATRVRTEARLTVKRSTTRVSAESAVSRFDDGIVTG